MCGAIIAGLLLLALLPSALAESWQGALQRGGTLTVDPGSRRALIEQDGRERPLWDGVHRLEDGSTVTIRDGIAVPTAAMLDTWRGGPVPAATYIDRYCQQLVRKTCGFDNACNHGAACLRARTLLAAEGREQRDLPLTAGSHPQTDTSGRCRAALAEPDFTACPSLTAVTGDSRCRALVAQACGEADACATSAACDAARQLLALETEERLENDDPAVASLTGRQCLEALDNPFFAACLTANPAANR
ncbi:MAG: hypothetical protein EA400_01955 [Chromatiaceae bacterium]|nr:MAG: hypothetical protein EA400_01955 [Chromatiaceae bacterium]